MKPLEAIVLSKTFSSTVSALAFEGAVGCGAVATGGNSGTPVHVTTLADWGAGSFRDVVSQPNRIIVFDVGGYIRLDSAISLSSNLTVNGQSAPGNGVGIMGAEVSASSRGNIIIRHLWMRQGTLDPNTGSSAFDMGKTANIILDHCCRIRSIGLD
ncbi:hypothetical protein RU639_002356 [Aspergillus parasiticus]